MDSFTRIEVKPCGSIFKYYAEMDGNPDWRQYGNSAEEAIGKLIIAYWPDIDKPLKLTIEL